jgi:VIT1/CCC1 family predicted Fe2+/Mn2+ transporter
MSMAAGEYVSVSSQADTERADLARERAELAGDPGSEHGELAAIYVARGLAPDLAGEVATQLMAHDAIGAHARDELGLVPGGHARPIQAAFTSALTFTVGAAMPLLMVLIAPAAMLVLAVAVGSLLFLAVLGGVGAWVGGAPLGKAIVRVTFWGAFAMAATAGAGALFGATV